MKMIGFIPYIEAISLFISIGKCMIYNFSLVRLQWRLFALYLKKNYSFSINKLVYIFINLSIAI